MRRQTAALKRKQSGDKGFVFTVRAGLAQEHLYWGVAYSFFILALISSLLPRSVWVGNCQTAAAAAAAASVAALGPLSLSFTLFPPPPLHTLSFLASRSSHSLTPPPKTLLLNNLPPSFSPFLSCVLPGTACVCGELHNSTLLNKNQHRYSLRLHQESTEERCHWQLEYEQPNRPALISASPNIMS